MWQITVLRIVFVILSGVMLYLLLLNLLGWMADIRLRRRMTNKKVQKISGTKIFFLYLTVLTVISVLCFWVIRIWIRSLI